MTKGKRWQKNDDKEKILMVSYTFGVCDIVIDGLCINRPRLSDP
jgi:hypothetical protein